MEGRVCGASGDRPISISGLSKDREVDPAVLGLSAEARRREPHVRMQNGRNRNRISGRFEPSAN